MQQTEEVDGSIMEGRRGGREGGCEWVDDGWMDGWIVDDG